MRSRNGPSQLKSSAPAAVRFGEDTIVRVSARELRKRLVQFYATPEGLACTCASTCHRSYTPRFHYAALPVVEPTLHAPAAVLE